MFMSKSKQIIPFLVMGCFLNACQKQPPTEPSTVDFCHDSLWKEILEKVQQEYFEQPDAKKMREGALSGMLNALDPYSTYMNQETYELFRESTNGEFGGIGIEVLFMDDSLRVIAHG